MPKFEVIRKFEVTEVCIVEARGQWEAMVKATADDDEGNEIEVKETSDGEYETSPGWVRIIE